MNGKIRNYYVDGNTARGYRCFYKFNFEGLRRLFVIKGVHSLCKSALMKKTGIEYIAKGYDIELMDSALDTGLVTGLVGVGILDGNRQHDVDF